MIMSMTSHSQKSSPFPKIILLVVLTLLLFGGFFAASTLLRPTQTVMNAADAAPKAAVAAVPLAAGTNDQLLVWIGNGAAPGQHSAANPGQLAFMDGTGVANPLMDIPAQTIYVKPCGDKPSSSDGNLFAFFVGTDTGKLYLKKGADAPTAVADVNALACLGNGTFQFSPDGARMAYISYEPDAIKSEFADGYLHVLNMGSMSEDFKYENVSSFAINNNGIALVSLFTNDKNEADEAAVIWWNGSGQKEVATLSPTSEDCKFTSAAINVLPDGKFLLVMGHRCKKGDTRTSWQLYSVDPESRSATLAASDFQAGQFASFARSNTIFVSPDGARAYFTVPDGITASTVGLKMVNVADLSLSDVLDKQGVAATYSGGANAFPRVSPDGKWLAMVVTSPNNENQVNIWNMTDPSVAPIVLKAGSKGDTVSNMEFTPDSRRLLVVAGGDNAADNSLIAIEVASGNDFRVARGKFGRGLTISPDGSEVAILNWETLEDPKEPPYATTVIIGVDSSDVATIYKGADIVDGKVTNQTFAFPMAWRKS